MTGNHIASWLLCCLCAGLVLAGCSSTKNIPANDHLFVGNTWMIDSTPLDKEVRSDMGKVLRPKPNSRMLGMPLKLWFYNFLPEPKKQKGLLFKMKTQWAEAPVLMSQLNPELMEKTLHGHLFDHGYFHANIAHDTVIKGSRGYMRFRINPGSRFRIREIVYPQDSSALSGLMRNTAAGSLLRKGEYLNLETLEKERERIDEYLKNHGYFFFNPENVLYKTDTLDKGLADIYITIKKETPAIALETWRIGKISVYGNYSIQKDSIITRQKGKRETRFTLIDNRERYKAQVYETALLIRENQLYRKNLHSLSIERMMNLNTFRFVKFVFLPDTSNHKRLLNTRVLVTPMKKTTLRLETSAYGKTGNFIGSELSLKLRNVNLLKGAEIFDFKITGGFDLQLGGRQVQSSNAYTLQGELSLYLPRIFPYFKVVTGRNSFIPRTGITMGVEYLQRPDLYTQRTTRLDLEYVWKYRKTTEHKLTPIRIKSIDPSNTTPKFDSILAEDISLQASFEKQLILGSQYQFHYTNTFLDKKRFTHAFRFLAGTSGNLFSVFSNPPVDTPGAKRLFDIPVAQFVRLEADLRGYLRLSPRLNWANRVTAGTAIAYGNSRIVPYAEQFFIGGSSSIRAFRIRTLGPGSHHTEEKAYQANESGDIKFEANTELRFHTGKYIQLAGFVDAGNIWLRTEPSDKPGSGLSPGDFFREMAVGAGLGLRLDFSILMLRFDLATPLRKPWLPEGERWVIDNIDLGSREWRKENLLLNIGIGYPF